MVTSIQNIEPTLKRFRLSKKKSDIVQEIIEKQLFFYKKLNLDPSDVSLIIVSQKIGKIDTIRVFGQNKIPIESLDLSYFKAKNLVSLEDSKIDFVFWVKFFDEGKTVSIVRGKVSDILNLKYMKVKTMTYGVTDGKEIIKIDIFQADVKGTENEVLQGVVEYTFHKKTNLKEKVNLDYVAIAYK